MAICLVCQGMERTAVDEALMAGVSVREVASRFSLSKSGVGRHRTGCLQPKLAAAARIVAPAAEVRGDVERAKAIVSGKSPANHDDILSLTALMGRLARSLERLEGAADTASGENLHTALAAVSAQLHRGIESAAKIQGLYAEPTVEGVGSRFSINITIPPPRDGKPAFRDVTPDAEGEPFTLRFAAAQNHHPAQ